MIPITSESIHRADDCDHDTTRYSHNIHTESPHIYWLPDV